MISGIVTYTQTTVVRAVKAHPYLFAGTLLMGAYSIYNIYKYANNRRVLDYAYNRMPNPVPPLTTGTVPTTTPTTTVPTTTVPTTVHIPTLNLPNRTNDNAESEWIISTTLFSPNNTRKYWNHLENISNWIVVTTEMNWVNNPNHLWVNLGASKYSEALFFNENAEYMMNLKRRVLAASLGKPVAEVLSIANQYINQLSDYSCDDQYNNFLLNRAQQNNNPNPAVLMEEIIARKFFVCSHRSLIACSVLAYLVENQCLPFGEVRKYRSYLWNENGVTDTQFAQLRLSRTDLNKDNEALRGTHGWAMYYENESKTLWLVDPQWEEAINLNTHLDHAYKFYGFSVINDMKERLRKIAEDTNDMHKMTERMCSLKLI